MFALLLSLLLVCGSFHAVGAAVVQRDPIVYVTGFGASHLMKGGDTVYPAPGSQVAKAVTALIPAYTAYRLNNNTRAFANQIVTQVTALYKPLLCDNSGDALDKDVTVENQNVVSADQPYGKRNYFYYDWRLDVTQTAADLNDYINAILAATDAQRVALICSSMGTCVGAAYLERYGAQNLSSIVFSSAAANGVPLVSRMMAGTLPLSEDVVFHELQALHLLDGANLSAVAKRTLDAVGGIDAVLRDVAHVANTEKSTLYTGLVVPFLSKMPGLWSFVEPSALSACITNTGVDAFPVLAQKIKLLHSTALPHLNENLQAAKDGGVKLAILCSDTGATALTEDGVLTDDLVPTALTSFGATCAPAGERLPFTFDEDEDALPRYAPDRRLDASTCAFPDNTWFVRGAAHTVTDPRFFLWVAYAESHVDVDANDKYPQFLTMAADGTYAAQVPTVDDLPAELLAVLPNVLQKVRALLKSLSSLGKGAAA